MKRSGLKLAVAATAGLLLAQEAMATTGFARQTGMSCTACHTHHISILNDFGKSFKMSGYTMSSDTGHQTLIKESEEGMLALPSTLNLSLMTKTRYAQNTYAESDNKKNRGKEEGVVEMFDEAYLGIAGKIANNWGFISEFVEGVVAGKFIGSWDLLGGKGGISLYTTDGFGPSYSQELYNTGIYRPARAFENRKNTNAAHATNSIVGAATGFSGFLQTNGVFVNVGTFQPYQFAEDHTQGAGLVNSIYYRLAYEMKPAGWTGMVGVSGTSGETTSYADDGDSTTVDPKIVQATNSMNIDTQWLGTVADKSMNISAVYSTTKGEDDSIFASSDQTAVSADVSYQTTKNLFLKMAYLTYSYADDDTKDYTAITPGFDYLINTNMKGSLEYSIKDYPNTDATYKDGTELLGMLYIIF